MFRHKAIQLGLLVLTVAFVASGCGEQEEQTSGTLPGGVGEKQVKPGETRPEVVVGFSIFDMQYSFFQEMEEGTREACKELNYGYILHDQKSDPALMVSGCENLMTQGIDILIISPFEPSALGPIVKKAKDRGIPVVINDIGGGSSAYDAIIISDCYGGGVIGANYIVKQLAKRTDAAKEVGILKCYPDHVYAIRRGEGFRDTMVKLGYETYELCANSSRDQGYRVAQDMLTAHPKICAIFAEDDAMALGAIQAIRDAGKSAISDVLVVGFDAAPEGIEAIQAGIMAATVRQKPYEMGKQCVMLVESLLKGEKLTFTNPELREITVPVDLVTQENIDELYPQTAKEKDEEGR
ncbi:substrate-binding domain-containing protein [Candidatus Sumerlaeota bacterium]